MSRAAVSFFRQRFREQSDPTRAAGEKAYHKSALRFHGVTQPQIRAAGRDFVLANPELGRRELRALAEALYATSYFDLRSAAIAVLERRVKQLEPADLRWLIELVRQSAAWAHVDWLATKVIGAVVARDPRGAARLRRWAVDDDFWVRRTALLAQLEPLRRGGGDFELFGELAAPMLEEKEFFIRKAIGWVLREVGKKRPALVREFLRTHGARASGLTRREATRYL